VERVRLSAIRTTTNRSIENVRHTGKPARAFDDNQQRADPEAARAPNPGVSAVRPRRAPLDEYWLDRVRWQDAT
jgi:hypothetical protein